MKPYFTTTFGKVVQLFVNNQMGNFNQIKCRIEMNQNMPNDLEKKKFVFAIKLLLQIKLIE